MSSIPSLATRPAVSPAQASAALRGAPKVEVQENTDSYSPQSTSDAEGESRLKVYSSVALMGAVVASPVLLGALAGPVVTILGAGALTALVGYNYDDTSEYHDRPFNALGNFAGLTAMGLIGSSFGLGVGIGAVALGAALGMGAVAAFDDKLFPSS